MLYKGVGGVENLGILYIYIENSYRVFLKSNLLIAQLLGKGLGSMECWLLDMEEVKASCRVQYTVILLIALQLIVPISLDRAYFNTRKEWNWWAFSMSSLDRSSISSYYKVY
jgi:hypothetical protein